jgi:hypothetical protein
MFILPTIIQNGIRFPSQSSKTGEINKRGTNREEEVKLFLYTHNMILYLKDPKNYTLKLLHIINTFIKVAGYKNQYIKCSTTGRWWLMLVILDTWEAESVRITV